MSKKPFVLGEDVKKALAILVSINDDTPQDEEPIKEEPAETKQEAEKPADDATENGEPEVDDNHLLGVDSVLAVGLARSTVTNKKGEKEHALVMTLLSGFKIILPILKASDALKIAAAVMTMAHEMAKEEAAANEKDA